MSKTHLSYEDSVLLKERGFDEPCDRKWFKCGEHMVSTCCEGPYTLEDLQEDEVLRPSYTQSCIWLEKRISETRERIYEKIKQQSK